MSRQVDLGQIVPNIQVGTTTTGLPSTPASVENVGTDLNPIFNFTIPKGNTGATPNIQIGNVQTGDTSEVTRTGTDENPILNFTLEKGDTGNGIASIAKTSTSGLVDTYTITFTNGQTTTFEVTNGENGDVVDVQVDGTSVVDNGIANIVGLAEMKQELEDMYNLLPKVTGEGTSITLDNTKEGKMKIVLKGNTSQEGTPTPETPQDIHVVSGNNSIKVNGRNFFEPFANGSITSLQEATTSIATIKQTYNYTRVLTFNNGEITGYPRVGNGSYYIFNLTHKNLKPNTTYTISLDYNFTNLTGTTGNLIIYGYIVTAPSGQTSTSGKLVKTFTTNANGEYVLNSTFLNIAMVCCNENTFMKLSNIMLVEGQYTSTTMPEYEPYQGASYPITLPEGMFLGWIPNTDYRDRIFQAKTGDAYYDSLDSTTKESLTYGKWYLKKEISKKSNLSSYYRDLTTNYNNLQYIRINKMTDSANYGNSNNIPVVFTHGIYQVITAFDQAVNIGRITSSGGYPYFYFGVDKTTTIEQAQTLLSNATIYYPLATPTYTEITDSTLLSQLEALEKARSYNEQTNISQNNNDLPFIINATALKEMA